MRVKAHTVLSRWLLQHDAARIPFRRRGKVAVKIEELTSRLDPLVRERSKDIKVRLKEKPLPFEWEFIAFSKDKKYVVSVRALIDESTQDKRLVKNSDILISCSCPFWVWQGPEFHAKTENYMFGVPRGTATEPDIRDPEKKKVLCKHALKVLETMKNYAIG
jgi:hypothetical protein